MRFGRMPEGFAFIPDPIGRGMDYDATIRTGAQTFFYGTIVIRGSGIGLALPRQGNILRNGNRWTEDNTIDMEHFVSQLILGAHYETARWGAHLSFLISTDTIKESSVVAKEDTDNSFGAILLERRF